MFLKHKILKVLDINIQDVFDTYNFQGARYRIIAYINIQGVFDVYNFQDARQL